MSWKERKFRLRHLLRLESQGDDEEGRAIDALVLQREAQQGKSSLNELDELRFTNRDLSNLGALAHGPFGSVDMVRCRLDSKLYVRKTVEKRVVARNPAQCHPHHEKDILIAATTSSSVWAPQLLCTFQTSLHLCYVMEFAENGSLGDLLESSGQIPEMDIMWWLPQMIAAIHWCHSQGFCHRDIKPSNFVITSSYHLKLIDFASSARLLPPDKDGVQLIPKESCLVLCGTCDYISPEILSMQEAALVALDTEQEIFVPEGEGGYGRETDWWSLGATVYELVYGIAPFFAKDISATYELIMNHERRLRFPSGSEVSFHCVSFISGLLRTAIRRLGRKNITEITSHKLFADISWSTLASRSRPSELHHPEFEYDLPTQSIKDDGDDDENYSKGFAFSAFFNSSVSASSDNTNPNAANLTFARATTPFTATEVPNPLPPHLVQYVGFTWGPTSDAFDGDIHSPRNPAPTKPLSNLQTPVPSAKRARFSQTPGPSSMPSTQNKFVTPIRPTSSAYPPSTIRRTVGGTARKSGSTRAVSEVEALKQMGDCIRASAQKKMSAYAGRTPGPGVRFGSAESRIGRDTGSTRRKSWARMTLDFERMGDTPGPAAAGNQSGVGSGGMRIFVKDKTLKEDESQIRRRSYMEARRSPSPDAPPDSDEGGDSTGAVLFGTVRQRASGRTEILDGLDLPSTDDDAPPSPSPSPRPTSAMSRPASALSRPMSELSRRGLTPVFSSLHPASTSISGAGAGTVGISASNISTNPRPVSFHRASNPSLNLSSKWAAKPSPVEPIFKPVSKTSPSPPNSMPQGEPSTIRKKGNPLRIVEDNDATPRAPAKKYASSAPPVFVPPLPIGLSPTVPQDDPSRLDINPVIARDFAQPSTIDLESEPTPRKNAQEEYLSRIPTRTNDEVEREERRKQAEEAKFQEMEARLRTLMGDLDRVQNGLKAVKTRMSTQ